MSNEKFVVTYRMIVMVLLAVLSSGAGVGAWFLKEMYQMQVHTYKFVLYQEWYNKETERINALQNDVQVSQASEIKRNRNEIDLHGKQLVRLETILNKEYKFTVDPDDKQN